MKGGAEIAVVGGGLVGAALAWGLSQRGNDVALFDPAEDDFHASAGNFGLVWVQGKGAGAPHYADLTRRSAQMWGVFAAALGDATGIDVRYRMCGGVKIALSDAELEAMGDALRRVHNRQGPSGPRIIDAAELAARVPAVSPEAVGGVWCAEDGHADPLAPLAALRRALSSRPGAAVVRAGVEAIRPDGGAFVLRAAGRDHVAGRVVLAAGLGTPALAGPLGLDVPVRPQRGQILVTERLAPFLDVATHTVRQTGEGTVLIGDSKEDVGFDRSTTPSVGAAMAARAVRIFPRLAAARIVRQWGALRVMSPDGLPVYAQSQRHPGAMAVTCHSGVTLAAAHAGEVAQAIHEGVFADRYAAFAPARFGAAA